MIPERRHDHHALLRRIGQIQVKGNGFPAAEIVHKTDQTAVMPVIFKREHILFPLHADIALLTCDGQLPFLHERKTDNRLRHLFIFFKIQQGNTVHGHVAVMVDRQRQGKAVGADCVVVPLLDPRPLCRHSAAVVGSEQFRRVSGLDQFPILVVQRPRRSDPLLHSALPPRYPDNLRVIPTAQCHFGYSR